MVRPRKVFSSIFMVSGIELEFKGFARYLNLEILRNSYSSQKINIGLHPGGDAISASNTYFKMLSIV